MHFKIRQNGNAFPSFSLKTLRLTPNSDQLALIDMIGTCWGLYMVNFQHRSTHVFTHTRTTQSLSLVDTMLFSFTLCLWQWHHSVLLWVLPFSLRWQQGMKSAARNNGKESQSNILTSLPTTCQQNAAFPPMFTKAFLRISVWFAFPLLLEIPENVFAL